jgi:hypothetical protein
MARKTLLTESEIRRFMKLANMPGVGGKRMDEMYPPPGQRDDEEVEMDAAEVEMGPEGDEVAAMDVEMDVEEPMDEPMDDMGDMDGEGMMVSVDDFMAAFEEALEAVTGEEVSSEVDLDDAEVEDIEGGELDALGGPEAEPVPGEGEEIDFEAAEEDALQEKIVNKVASRVAARLVKENRKAKLTNELTERIFKRLTQK